MENPVENFWQVRLLELKEQLDNNNFQTFIADSVADANTLFFEKRREKKNLPLSYLYTEF